jgi:lysophospholipase L1-like esterase
MVVGRTKTILLDVNMKRIHALAWVVFFGSALQAQTINVRGRVSNDAGQPVAEAVVELLQQGLKDTTGLDGAYSIVKPGVSLRPNPASLQEGMRLENGILEFTVGGRARLKVEVYDVNGNLRNKESIPEAEPGVHHLKIPGFSHCNEMLIIQASIGPLVETFRFLPWLRNMPGQESTVAGAASAGGRLAKPAAAVDTLKISAAGYSSKKIALSAYDTTVSVTLDPDATSVYKPCPTNGTPCKILPFGDSITEGVGSSDGAGYRSQLFKLIVAASQKVTFVGSMTKGPTTVSGAAFPRSHEGHPGWTIEPGISEFSGYGGISTLVPNPALNGTPHIILLHIGANEFFTKDKATISTRLEALVEKLVQNAPNVLIVVAQHTPIGNSNGGHSQAQTEAANAARQSYNGRIPAIIQAQAAKGRHIIGVDMGKMPLSGLTTNSMHPNNQGYAYMADIWYAAIKDLLPK